MANVLDNNGCTTSVAGMHKLEMDSPLTKIAQEMFGGGILIEPGYRIGLPSKIAQNGQYIAARPSRP